MTPELLEIQLTHKCNLRCIYCGNNPDLISLPDLEIDIALKAISELKPKKILFTGGEVYLAFQTLITILNRLELASHEFILSSNLTSIPISDLELLIEKYHFRTFHSSFNDADVVMSHDIRGATAEERNHLSTNLKYLTQKKCNVKVETILLPQTIHKLVEINRCLHDLGVKHHKIEFLLPIGAADSDMLCTYGEIEDAILNLYHKKNNDSIIEMTCFYLTPCSQKTNKLFELSEKNKDFIYNECIDGHKTCYLLASGQLLPCFLFPENVYDTNVKSYNSYDIWTNHELFRNFRLDNDDCMQCEYYMRRDKGKTRKCNNGCTVLNYINSGQFASKSIIPEKMDSIGGYA